MRSLRIPSTPFPPFLLSCKPGFEPQVLRAARILPKIWQLISDYCNTSPKNINFWGTLSGNVFLEATLVYASCDTVLLIHNNDCILTVHNICQISALSKTPGDTLLVNLLRLFAKLIYYLSAFSGLEKETAWLSAIQWV